MLCLFDCASGGLDAFRGRDCLGEQPVFCLQGLEHLFLDVGVDERRAGRRASVGQRPEA
jgi:hypothetical protein